MWLSVRKSKAKLSPTSPFGVESRDELLTASICQPGGRPKVACFIHLILQKCFALLCRHTGFRQGHLRTFTEEKSEHLVDGIRNYCADTILASVPSKCLYPFSAVGSLAFPQDPMAPWSSGLRSTSTRHRPNTS